jgi:hypothetical protein
VYDNDGNPTQEFKAQAEELVVKIGSMCKDYHPAIVLFVLEAAMTEQISVFSPQLSNLFEETMGAFKAKAAVLIIVADMLKGRAEEIRNGASIEDILAEIGVSVPEPKPQE